MTATSALIAEARKATPMQPIERDAHGVIRFRKNRIVDDLLDFATVKGRGPNNPCPGYETPYERLDLNAIAVLVQRGTYTQEEYDQFYQLIGYSVSGYGDCSLVSPQSVELADEEAARLRTTETELPEEQKR